MKMKIETERDAIDALNILIRTLREFEMSETLIDQLDEIRQFLGRDL